MRQPTKAQTLYFKRQLDVRDEQLESDPSPESCDCKIWKWMNDINPQNGLGPCPCPHPTFKRVLSTPHPLSALFSGAHAALSIGSRKRSKTNGSKGSDSIRGVTDKPASMFSRTDSAISDNSNGMLTLTASSTRTAGSDTAAAALTIR